jgi:chaperonin GroES
MFEIFRRAVRAVFGAKVPLRVLGDGVLVRRAEAAATTAGGLHLPQQGGKPCEGEVVATGPGRRLRSGALLRPAARRGDWVLFGRMAGKELTWEGQEYVRLADAEVLAVLE